MDNIGFDTKEFEMLYKSEEKSFWFTNRNKLIIWLLQKYFKELKSFMEIGCGTGYVLSGIKKAFPQIDIVGSELFEEGLKFARMRNPEVNFVQLDALNLKLDKPKEVIGAFDVLEHIEDDEAVLRNIYNSISTSEGRGGGALITVPQHMFLWSDNDEKACHVRRYSKKELITKMENAGFQVVYCSSFVSLLFPFMLLSRKSKNSNDELNLNVFLNTCFSMVMSFERILLKAGIKFPFGGSLIAVGMIKK